MEVLDRPVVVYPDRDGKPMADITLQFQYITTIEGGIEAERQRAERMAARLRELGEQVDL